MDLNTAARKRKNEYHLKNDFIGVVE